jgi:hypothetical protein
MSVAAYGFILQKRGWLKPILLIAVLLIFCQGGGAVSLILHNPQNRYWPKPTIIRINQHIRDTLSPFIYNS